MTLKFQKSRALFLAALAVTTTAAFANDLSTVAPKGYFVIEGGAFRASQGRNQHVGINGLIGDQFTVTNHYDQNALLGLGYLWKGLDRERFSILYGINAFYLAHTQVRGYVIQEGIATNLSYNYSLTNYPIYAAAKMIIKTSDEKYGLTLDLGLGANIIQTNGFTETSIDGGVTQPDNIFSGQNSAAWSATAGLGVRFNHLLYGLPIEIGYRYFYLGQGHFYRTTNQTTNLYTGNNSANALVLSLFA